MQLKGDFGHPVWGAPQIKEELANKDLGYGGEEIGKVEKLSLEQITPSLPPRERGGSTKLDDWLSSSTKALLKDPSKLMIPDNGQKLPTLRGRVHVKEGERLDVARLLVERNVCIWRRAEDTLCYRGQSVRNGLFGVVKPGKIVNQKPVLRVIMNLIPTNSLFKIIPGSVHRLPSITQWSTLFIGEDEKVEISQADITSAFYLFLLPEVWQCILPFNIEADGRELGAGYIPRVRYVLCAKVLPMGWHSAVGLMEEAAERLLLDSGLPQPSVVNRVSKLPRGFTEILGREVNQAEPFWHIYLDNFASGQRVRGDQDTTQGGVLHRQALELGAKIHGRDGWLGVEPHRLLKVLKLSLWLAFRPNLRKKSLQICLGRWMHVLQFRRAAMSHFSAVWDFLTVARKRREWQARFELVIACFGGLLFHSDLTTQPSGIAGASDSSMRGGAVGMTVNLTDLGRDFLRYEEDLSRQGTVVPVLVISCFDGIGGCMRSYNVAGVRPQLYVSLEIHKPAKRVTSRRWPEIIEADDITKVNDDDILEWISKAGEIEEIHIWGGFPCKDLSAAKHRRDNLKWRYSGLFYELQRIWRRTQALAGERKTLLFAENVCSMDVAARDEISQELDMWPLRLDSEALVPMSRPRFVWTNLETVDTDSMWVEEKEGFSQVRFWCEPVCDLRWLEQGFLQLEGPTTYPTCMRAIVRQKPPERPVGLGRCSTEELMRWRQDQFRFPPYQYRNCYMVADKITGAVRYINASEREKLLGYGWGHTLPALSASAAKKMLQERLRGRETLVAGGLIPC